MRHVLIAVVGVALFTKCVSPLAQGEIEVPAVKGVVQSYDPQSRVIVLDDGTHYTLGENANANSLQEGAEITLSCDATDSNCAVVTSENTAGESSE